MKKYLFFDIECSNCFGNIGKICEFGYVITDENFNILTCDDIPMSPGDKKDRSVRFDKGIYKRDPNFKYSYLEEEYFSFKRFPSFYNRIKDLLTNDKYIVFGYAVDNDVSYLGSDIKRYKLPDIDYVANDVQVLAHKCLGTPKERPGLEKTFISLLGVNERVKLQAHLPMDDAKMTMLILKDICHRTGKTPEQLVSENENFRINAIDFLIKKEERRIALKTKRMNRLARKTNHKIWADFCEEMKDIKAGFETITISGGVQENKELVLHMIEFVKNNNYLPVLRVGECKHFVLSTKEELETLQSSFKYIDCYKWHLVDEFVD